MKLLLKAPRKTVMSKKILVLILGLFIGVGAADAQLAPSPLWNDLEPGPYQVGFEVQFVLDNSRSFYPPEFPQREDQGRPIRILVWYPGKRDAAAAPLRFGDYIDIDAPDARFAAYNDSVRLHDHRRIRGQVRHANSDSITNVLTATTTAAFQNLEPAEGLFPLILHSTGIGSWQPENTVLYEYLASHGYVVATVPQYGPRVDQRGMPYSQQGADIQRRDVETALAELIHRPFVDAHSIGLTGHSFGGLVALWLASRNQNIGAVASLDGSILIERGVELLRTIDWEPEDVRIPILNLYTLAQGLRDRSIVDSLRHAGRYHVIYRNGSHFDFQNWPLHVTLANSDDPRARRRRSHEEGRDIYLSVVQLTRHFFDAVLKGKAESLAYVRGEKPVLRALETTSFDFQAGMKSP
ncbi:MAG: alpha/beta fold hydrolase [Phycisphaerae bacterium]|nr:alpha/beta hydrolase [candidate division KSB1 bacterium]NIV01668.1 alpha/beta fold hydrolase [Phycisphaerae bacterium]NIT73766.1 alpha/beta hydrolase [candidate division KSB1 bacterium]NIU26713.1 alpha/beta hydrolase [candidate division KSB1 bacterium]NIV70929.1 alpha/beta fold hydrolase [Phycisphaerae bacterium]